MSQVTIQGNASGSGVFTVASPNSNNSRTLTLPDATGTAVLDSATQTLTNKTLTSPTITGGTATGTQVQGGAVTSDTAKASTSGTFIDFTGIPSWAKRVTVMFNGVSTNGTSGALVQLGAGSIDATGYVSGTSTVANNAVGSLVTSTAGIVAASALVAAQTLNGAVIFVLVGSNIWVASGTTYSSATGTHAVAGNKTLSGTLDRIRVTTINGTDTFDAGSINILYEG